MKLLRGGGVKTCIKIVLNNKSNHKTCFVSCSQDVLYTICNNCGPVQRIVIFRKNGVQAMVEYPFRSSLADILFVNCEKQRKAGIFINI